MYLEEEEEPYEITFAGTPLPNEVTLKFPGLGIWFYISDVNLPWIIPAFLQSILLSRSLMRKMNLSLISSTRKRRKVFPFSIKGKNR